MGDEKKTAEDVGAGLQVRLNERVGCRQKNKKKAQRNMSLAGAPMLNL